MYEYVIDTIEMVTRGFRWVPAVEPGEVIARRAGEGWRFCQIYIPPNSSGMAQQLQIIFERPASGPRDRSSADAGTQQWPQR